MFLRSWLILHGSILKYIRYLTESSKLSLNGEPYNLRRENKSDSSIYKK